MRDFYRVLTVEGKDMFIRLCVFVLLFLQGAGVLGDEFDAAMENGRRANEGFRRCRDYVHGWLKYADKETGLIPRNLKGDRDIWNAKDSAADNYPFMVLTSAVLERDLFYGQMQAILETERRLTSRVGVLPDSYSFSKDGFAESECNISGVIFGSSEYVKDGLLPLTEWLGPSAWSERMVELVEGIRERASVETEFGRIPSENDEVNGEMLVSLSRLYWMTGREEYLDFGVRLGDYYFLGNNHPTRDFSSLRLRDHGCEVICGLCELYFALHFARPEKKASYYKPMHEMLGRILEVGRNEHGLFYDIVNPQTGVQRGAAADTWGYTLNGFYTVYLIDGTQRYREAVIRALGSLFEHYRDYDWEHGSADGYADSIESALNLYNREEVISAAEWIESEIRVMWGKQGSDGIIEGWHGDGNFARTTIMYCLWRSQGLTIEPWEADVMFGAVLDGELLKVSITSEKPWKGLLIFDKPRHRSYMHLPVDYPRINQFPEWFTVDSRKRYIIEDAAFGGAEEYWGEELQKGVSLRLKEGVNYRYSVKRSGD